LHHIFVVRVRKTTGGLCQAGGGLEGEEEEEKEEEKGPWKAGQRRVILSPLAP